MPNALPAVAIVCCLTAITVAPAVHAEEPEGRAVLEKTARAIKNLKAISYSATRDGVGFLAAVSPTVTGTVLIDGPAPDEPEKWTFAIRGSILDVGAEAPAEFQQFSAGGRVTTLLQATSEIVEGQPEQAMDMLGDGGRWITSWLLRWDELVNNPVLMNRDAEATWIGAKIVSGELCDIVHIDYSEVDNAELAAQWFIARGDSLPRRIEVHYVNDEEESGFAVLTLSDVRVNPEIGPASFAVPSTARYTVRKFVADAEGDQREEAAQPAALKVGQPAPDFTLASPDGAKVSLASLKGQVVVLDFWATWCGPCVRAMPDLQKIHEQYKDRGVQVLGVNTWENGDPVKFKKDKGYTYGLLLKGDDVAARYGVTGIPAFFVIGKDGKIAGMSMGFSPNLKATLSATIDAALAQ